ncbi:MAG: hypothetical protein HYZ37_15265 [Candidatus Solibacter usitatus]|nr:hypothetical protein [Candidatus Solibacter usitatus]
MAIAFASCTEDLQKPFLAQVRNLNPDARLYVVSEFPVEGAHWVPAHLDRSWAENVARLRDTFRGRRVSYAGVVLQPNLPYWKLRLIPLWLWPMRTVLYNENLDHFMLRPRCASTIVRHCLWRTRNFFASRKTQAVAIWRLMTNPIERRRVAAILAARTAGVVAAALKALQPPMRDPRMTVRLKPGVAVIPATSPAAVNRALRNVRFSHVVLTDGNSAPEIECIEKMQRAFRRIPDLFAATTRMPAQRASPGGEDLAYVLHGSADCTMYDTAKLLTLGGLPDSYATEEVRHMDLGYRGWFSRPPRNAQPEDAFLQLTSGTVAVFPGRQSSLGRS